MAGERSTLNEKAVSKYCIRAVFPVTMKSIFVIALASIFIYSVSGDPPNTPQPLTNATSPKPTNPSSPSPCPPGWYYATDLEQCYLIPNVFLKFDDARFYCANDAGGQLVSVYDAVEYYAISVYLQQQIFIQAWSAWIGLQTYPYAPYFRWLDRHNANYTHWINGTAPAHTNANACFAWNKTKPNDGWFMSDCNQQRPFICKRHAAICPDTNVNGNSGVITSPNYPGPYDLEVACAYHITVPEGHIVQLSFNLVVMDPYSNITIYDGPTTKSPVLELISSTSIQNVVESTSNSLSVQFFASNYGGSAYIGWSATFKAIVPVTLSGALTSPKYPHNYPDEDKKTYKLNVPLGYRVLVTIWDFVTEEGSDYLTISDDSDYLLEWAGDMSSQVPKSVRSHNNTMTIDWSSDMNTNFRGWNLTWVADPIWG